MNASEKQRLCELYNYNVEQFCRELLLQISENGNDIPKKWGVAVKKITSLLEIKECREGISYDFELDEFEQAVEGLLALLGNEIVLDEDDKARLLQPKDVVNFIIDIDDEMVSGVGVIAETDDVGFNLVFDKQSIEGEYCGSGIEYVLYDDIESLSLESMSETAKKQFIKYILNAVNQNKEKCKTNDERKITDR